jgi:antitoxin (DNA-binding transcriptional repressor) of toxin-antitoxin stability system
MRMVGLKLLRNKLSEYVRLAARGETILVTDRNRVVAELVAPQHGRAAVLAGGWRAELIREGLLTPRRLPVGTVPQWKQGTVSFEDLMCELDSDRADRE